MRNYGLVSRRGFLKAGLVGVVGGAGAVGLSGCTSNPIVNALTARVVYDRFVKGGEGVEENKELAQGPEVPYDVDFLAYYRIEDLKTGDVEIVEGDYGNLSKNWETDLKAQYVGKCPNGYRVEMIEGDRLVSIRESIQ